MAIDFQVAAARRNSQKQIFQEENFTKTLYTVDRVGDQFFAYCCFLEISKTERSFRRDKSNPFGEANFGQALRYGKYAVVAICNALASEKTFDKVAETVEKILDRWSSFEAFAIEKPTNIAYFSKKEDPNTGKITDERNFDNYYKGKTIVDDLKNFFIKSKV